MKSRTQTLTQKVHTPFGNLYAHVAFDGLGRPCEVAVSTPGKFHDTGVHIALLTLTQAITAILQIGQSCDSDE